MTSYITLRIDKSARDAFTALCQRGGLPLSGAVTLLAEKVAADGEIPFDLYNVETTTEPKKNSVMGVYVDEAVRSRFADVCASYGVSVSTVIRGYIMACIADNSFLYKPTRKPNK